MTAWRKYVVHTWDHLTLFPMGVHTVQARRKVWKSGGAGSTVVGIIWPPGWDRVNCSAQNWEGLNPPQLPACDSPAKLKVASGQLLENLWTELSWSLLISAVMTLAAVSNVENAKISGFLKKMNKALNLPKVTFWILDALQLELKIS